MASALRVIAGGQQKLDESRVEVLSMFDETERVADELYALLDTMDADYRRITGLRDLRFRSATGRLERLGAHVRDARSEYLGLTGGAA